MPPPVWGEVGGFSFFWTSGRGLPPVGFGGRGGFISRLGAGGGDDDRLSGTLTGEQGPRHLCHRCLIKAQAAASVGLTGLYLDTAKKRELGDRPSCKEKGAPARATCFAYAQLS